MLAPQDGLLIGPKSSNCDHFECQQASEDLQGLDLSFRVSLTYYGEVEGCWHLSLCMIWQLWLPCTRWMQLHIDWPRCSRGGVGIGCPATPGASCRLGGIG